MSAKSFFSSLSVSAFYLRTVFSAARRTTYLPPGYNIWAKVLHDKLEPGQFYASPEDVDKFVGRKVRDC